MLFLNTLKHSARVVIGSGLSLLAVLGMSPAFAQEGDGPALWTIEDEDTVVHLFGTVHVLKPDLDWRSDVFEEAWRGADTVYFETTTDGNEAEMASLVLQLGMNPVGVKLTDSLNADQVALLNDAANRIGMPVVGLDTMRPWFAAITISVSLLMSEGHDPESGVESILEPEAKRLGKDLRYFETAEQQLRFFADLPHEVQVEFLMQSLGEMEEVETLIDSMDDAWINGDLEALNTLVLEDMQAEAPEVYEVLIKGRNEAWISDIDALMSEPGTFFIAVGAAHLVGEDSVITGLRNQGWKITGP